MERHCQAGTGSGRGLEQAERLQEILGATFNAAQSGLCSLVELGLEPQGDGTVEGRWVDRVVGLEAVRVDFAMMETPDGNGRLELVKFHSPANEGDNPDAPANTRVSATSHSPSKISMPSSQEGIIIELAERIG